LLRVAYLCEDSDVATCTSPCRKFEDGFIAKRRAFVTKKPIEGRALTRNVPPASKGLARKRLSGFASGGLGNMLASDGMRAVRMPPTSGVVGDRAAWSVLGGNVRPPGRGRRRGARGRAGLDRERFRRNRGRITGRSGWWAGGGLPPHRSSGDGAGYRRKRIELDDDQAS
jgi:hypothetical protein